MEAYQVMLLLVVIGLIVAVVWEILELRDELENATEEAVYLKLRLPEEKLIELRELRHNVEKMKGFDKLEEHFVLNDDSIESYELSNDSFGFLTFTMHLNNPIRGERFGLTLENGRQYDCYIEENKGVNNSSYYYSGTGHFVPRLEDL